SDHFPEISLHEMLNWACLNGAAFLGKEDVLGSFERGKRPGIVLIENVDLLSGKLLNESTSKRIDL
ncbi:MAG TPA: amidohydrolase family protein, partial [Bacteroidia bacterium]|nr:amidohydrolase family protein [Bacteroidia bacterium]